MNQELLTGHNGCAVPCLHTLTGGEKMVCVISHGFGSSKNSPTAQMLLSQLPPQGIGALAFDFPAHGDSSVEGDFLSIGLCLDHLARAEARAAELAPGAEIVYFSSSFGAYLNLIYLSTRPHRGQKSFLRSAAVEMPVLFHSPTPEQARTLETQGWLMLDRGYQRLIKLTPAFLADLDAHDLFQLCRPGSAAVAMIHGDADQTASVEAARRFARTFGAALTEVPGGDHSLSIPGAPEQVLGRALDFFLDGKRGGPVV